MDSVADKETQVLLFFLQELLYSTLNRVRSLDLCCMFVMLTTSLPMTWSHRKETCYLCDNCCIARFTLSC